MSIITKTSCLSSVSYICILEYVIAFTSVPCGCFPISNGSPYLKIGEGKCCNCPKFF